MAFIRLLICRGIQSRLQLIYIYICMLRVVDRVNVRSLPHVRLLLLFPEQSSRIFGINTVHSYYPRLDSYPWTQATSPCTNDARAKIPALTAIPTSAFLEQRPTPIPKVGEKKRSRISSHATLALSMTRLMTIISWSSRSIQVLDVSLSALLQISSGRWSSSLLLSPGKEPTLSMSRG